MLFHTRSLELLVVDILLLVDTLLYRHHHEGMCIGQIDEGGAKANVDGTVVDVCLIY